MKRGLVIAALIVLQGCAVLSSRELFVACKTADVVTTKIALSKGYIEANPFMAQLGFGGFVALSALLILFIWNYSDDIGEVGMIAVNGVTCGTAIHNYGVIK